MKQLSLGLVQYSGDYDEKLPQYIGWAGESASGIVADPKLAWYLVIQPYVKNYQIIRCPSVHAYLGGSFPDNQYSTSYCMPGLGNTKVKRVAWAYDGLKQSEVKEPARTFMVTESAYSSLTHTYFVDSGYGFPYCRFDNITSTTPEDGVSSHYMAYKNHFDGYNVAFMDGHVKWLLKGTSKDYVWDNNRN